MIRVYLGFQSFGVWLAANTTHNKDAEPLNRPQHPRSIHSAGLSHAEHLLGLKTRAEEAVLSMQDTNLTQAGLEQGLMLGRGFWHVLVLYYYIITESHFYIMI